MKKASTYYFAVLAVANLFVAHVFLSLNDLIGSEFGAKLEGKCLPVVTGLFRAVPWWPYVFVILFLAGVLLSLGTRCRSKALCHTVIVLLMLEAFVLFFNVFAYALPLDAIIKTIS